MQVARPRKQSFIGGNGAGFPINIQGKLGALLLGPSPKHAKLLGAWTHGQQRRMEGPAPLFLVLKALTPL